MKFGLRRADFCKALVGLSPEVPIKIVVNAEEGVYLERAAEEGDEPLVLSIDKFVVENPLQRCGEATILAKHFLAACKSAGSAKSLVVTVEPHRPDRLKITSVGGQKAEWSFVIAPLAPTPAAMKPTGVVTIQTSSEPIVTPEPAVVVPPPIVFPATLDLTGVKMEPTPREPCINPACKTTKGGLQPSGKYERSKGRCTACYNYLRRHGVDRPATESTS